MATVKDTNQSGRRRIIIMAIVLIVLGAIAGGVAWYMSTIEEFTPTDTSAHTFDTGVLCQELVAERISSDGTTTEYYSADDTRITPIELTTNDRFYISAIGEEIPSEADSNYEILGFELTLNGEALDNTTFEETSDTPWKLTPTDSTTDGVTSTEVDFDSNLFNTFIQDSYNITPTEVLTDYNIYRTEVALDDYVDVSTLRIVAKILVNTPDQTTDEVTCAEVFLKSTEVITPTDPGDDVVIDDPVDDPANDPIDDVDDPTTPTDDDTEDPQDGEDTSTTSNLTVTVDGTTCVERVEPDDVSTYTITITNQDTDSEEVVTVVNKLPLGFTYTAGSTKVNGEVQDDTLVTVTDTGDSQDLTWDPDTNWSLAAGGILTIQFSATAGEDALTGSVQDEVVVTPVNTPVNAENLRAEYVFTVAQNCENPETGVFDSTLGRIAVGLIIVLIGGFIYYSNSGLALSEKIVTSDAYSRSTRSVELFGLKITNPRKHFEEKVKDRTEK